MVDAYACFALKPYPALTLDVQYVKDEYNNADAPNGIICGLRLAAGF
jgi:hypothetical protein